MTTLDHQSTDWTAPVTHRVAESVYRIPLALPLQDLRSVNCYALTSNNSVTLVDPGWASASTERALSAALSDLGFTLADVEQIIVTHTHWDHYTQAIALRDAYGTPVLVGEQERHTIAAFEEIAGMHPGQVALLRTCGATDLADLIEATELEEHEKDVPFGEPDAWLEDGQRLAVGDRMLEVHHTPGHTRGHMIVTDPDRDVMITGDHILPRITPSIGFERAPEALPLASFLESLARVKSLPNAQMLPAHGRVTPHVHDRVDALLAHHDERFDAVLSQVASGRHTAADIGGALTWTRHERALADLRAIHRMMAILEISAHLDVLVLQGRLERTEIDGVYHFAAAK
ncbi:MAG: MBL fold metallo-hydrolase [Rhodococcus sp. (in: high G+C Gram-positive bacteria)]|uniref:MBL fold metallo-hydrolase n=1 Tax=Rhodococcus sp. TaxID=1831 RepID=UPI003BB0DD21